MSVRILCSTNFISPKDRRCLSIRQYIYTQLLQQMAYINFYFRINLLARLPNE